MDDYGASYERDKLYQEVWEAPVRGVAKRYGVSDVYLARICSKMSIPLPGRGYWAKPKERRPPRPPLPDLTPDEYGVSPAFFCWGTRSRQFKSGHADHSFVPLGRSGSTEARVAALWPVRRSAGG